MDRANSDPYNPLPPNRSRSERQRQVWSQVVMRLSTDIWVGALIRRAELDGAYATVIRKGDSRGGAVLVKALDRRADAARLYAEAIRDDGERVWMSPVAATDEAALDAYIDRAIRFDPDVWVIEIDDRAGRHFLTEPVEPRI